MKEESGRKRPEPQYETVGVSGKRPKTLAISDGEDDSEMLSEETVKEVMKLLEEEMNNNNNNNNNNNWWFSSSSTNPNLLPPPPIPIPIPYSEEMCGPTFSDWSSTMMADIDMSSISSYLIQQQGFPFQSELSTSVVSSSYDPTTVIIEEPGGGDGGGRINQEQEMICENQIKINGCDDDHLVEDSDGEWLEKFLSGPHTPLSEFEQGF